MGCRKRWWVILRRLEGGVVEGVFSSDTGSVRFVSYIRGDGGPLISLVLWREADFGGSEKAPIYLAF
jgi:hypothetical protein